MSSRFSMLSIISSSSSATPSAARSARRLRLAAGRSSSSSSLSEGEQTQVIQVDPFSAGLLTSARCRRLPPHHKVVLSADVH